LLDREGYIVGVLAGHPKDKGWGQVHEDAFKTLQEAVSNMRYSDKERCNRKGLFPTVAHGISFGGGQKEPRYLRHDSEKKTEALEQLVRHKSIQRICKFTSCAFGVYSPKTYKYVKETMEILRASRDRTKSKKRQLRREYDRKLGVFPCRSFNLGEQTTSFPHRDVANLAQSWCSITPLGNFNPEKGGHLVLWDLGLVVEFPAGLTILIPSALIVHSNSSIQPQETRFSIVQYAAGGLFRWVQNGCMTDKALKEMEGCSGAEAQGDSQGTRWAEAMGMFTKIGELRA
ncbi:hypothetical protein JOM56_015124, partial [Amanita muscaria]